jgi:hypothetical protein
VHEHDSRSECTTMLKYKNWESFFEAKEQFRCLGTTVSNQNSIQVEVRSRLVSVNACCQSVQNLLYFSFLYRITIFPVLYGCETWSLTSREKRRLRVFENRFI